MVESFGQLMTLVIEFMQTEITFGSFTFSYWNVFMFSMVFSAVCILIRGFYGE